MLAGKMLESMCRLVYTVGEDQFGKQESKKQKKAYQPSRREREFINIRREIRMLSIRYKRSSEEERVGLKQLRQDLRKRLRVIRNAKKVRKNKYNNRKRAAFIRNPYGFSASLLERNR